MVINITVTDKRPVVDGTPVIVCGNSDYTIEFTFDEEWAEHLVKTARFVYYKASKTMHEDVVFNGNTVEVPVMSGVSAVFVGVYAGDLHTTTPARISCERSILCGDPVHEDPPEDVYRQINELIANIAGVYTLNEGETIEDAPEWAQVVVDPYDDPSTVNMTAVFEDGTSATYTLYGEVM